MTRLLLLLLACLLLSPTVAATAAGSAAVRHAAPRPCSSAPWSTCSACAADFDAAASDAWPWQPLARPTLGKQPDGAWLRLFARNGRTDARLWYLLLKWPVLDRVAVPCTTRTAVAGVPRCWQATPWR